MKRTAAKSVDEVVAGRRKTRRILQICFTALKSFLNISALLLFVLSFFLSLPGEGEQTLLGMFMTMLSILFGFAGTLLTLATLLMNVGITRLFSKWWNIFSLAGILFAILFFILYGLGVTWLAFLFLVWLILLCIPSGYEFTAGFRYWKQKKNKKKEASAP